MTLALTYSFGSGTGVGRQFFNQLQADLDLLAGQFPTSSTDNAVARFNGTAGALQDSGVIVDDSGNMGIGTATPGARFHIAADDFNAAGIVERAGDNAAGPSIDYRKSRGTLLAPTIVSANDGMGDFDFRGYDGTAYRASARVRGFVDGTPGANDMPGRIIIATSPIGSATTLERLRVSQDGALGHRANATTIVDASSHLGLRSYTVATLPTVSTSFMIYVSDGTTNKRLAVSDGANWRFPDGNVVS